MYLFITKPPGSEYRELIAHKLRHFKVDVTLAVWQKKNYFTLVKKKLVFTEHTVLHLPKFD